MRDSSDDLASYLLESVSYRLIADVFYDGERTWTTLPVVDWTLGWDLETGTKSDGTLTVVFQSDGGESLAPKDFLDTLAPYGQEVSVLLEVSFGSIFRETVLLGRYRITAAPQSTEDWFGFDGRPYVLGSTVQITIADLLTIPDAWDFRGPSVPKNTDSTWHELQRISTLPVSPNLPDKPTPANLVYSPSQGGRMQAIQQLMSYLGGIAVTNEYGELTSVPFAASGLALTLEMGTRGQIVSVQDALSIDQVVNEVCGEYQDDDGIPIYAWAVVASGPLATSGPLLTRTAPVDNDDTVTSVAAAKTRVEKVLRQYLGAQTITRTLTCIFDPRLQQGDVVNVNGPRTRRDDGTLSDPAWTSQAARVVKLTASKASNGLMQVVLQEGAAVNASIHVGP